MYPSLFPVNNGFDPLAPYPTQAPFNAPAPVSPDLINAGISPVGRPADLSSLQFNSDPSNGGIADAEAEKAQRKLDRQSKGEALLAFGANLLSSRTFGEGLGKGLMAYTQTLKANRPTARAIGDGEYEAVTDPRTGHTTYRPTSIHADKLKALANAARKPVPLGDHLWQYGVSDDGTYDGTAKDLAPPKLKRIDTHDAAGNPLVLFANDDTGQIFDPKSGANVAGPGAAPTGAPGVAPAPPPDDPSRTPAAAPAGGGFDAAIPFVLQHEGSKLNPSDWNGQPVKYGINQAYHPNVANLTEDGAKAIYKSDYWDKSGAASLPAPMQLPFFDTYVRNPAKAQAFLAQSRGDPNKFMALREAWDQAAAKRHPGDARGLANRDADLRAAGTAPDTSQPYYQGAPTDAPADTSTQPTPDNPWGLQPHDFSHKASGVRYLGKDELKAAGYPADAIVQRDAKGNDLVREKGTPADQNLPDNAITQQAEIFRRTGKMPAMGMGNPAVRDKIMSRAADLNQAEGINGGDIPAAQADYNNDVKARGERNSQLSLVNTSIGAALKHGADALRYASKVPAQTDWKLWNYVSQGILDQKSNPTLYALQGSAKIAEAEVAKAITGNPQSGAGQLTDEARKQFKIIEGPAGVKAKQAAWNAIVEMMQQKRDEVQSEITRIDGRMHGPLSNYTSGGASSRPAPPKPGTVVRGFRFNGGNPADQHNWTKT